MSQLDLSHEIVEKSPKTLCLALTGEVDHSNGKTAETYFDEVYEKESPKHVLLDLSKLTFAGSIFFSALLFWQETIKSEGGKFVVFGPTPEVLSTMRIFTLDRTLTICPDREAALAGIK